MIRDVTLKTCRRRWMIGRRGERGSGISLLAARPDDDDIWPIDGTLIDTTTLILVRPGNNGNKGVSSLPRCPNLLPHHWIQVSIISFLFWEGVILLSREYNQGILRRRLGLVMFLRHKNITLYIKYLAPYFKKKKICSNVLYIRNCICTCFDILVTTLSFFFVLYYTESGKII